MRYIFSAILLLMKGVITWPIFKIAICQRPVAVCGKNGYFVVDQGFVRVYEIKMNQSGSYCRYWF